MISKLSNTYYTFNFWIIQLKSLCNAIFFFKKNFKLKRQ